MHARGATFQCGFLRTCGLSGEDLGRTWGGVGSRTGGMGWPVEGRGPPSASPVSSALGAWACAPVCIRTGLRGEGQECLIEEAGRGGILSSCDGSMLLTYLCV